MILPGTYKRFIPGVDAANDTTAILSQDSEPQPHVSLRLVNGVQTSVAPNDYLTGCPEWVAEIASSIESYDPHAKLEDYERYGAIDYVVVIVRSSDVVWFRRTNGKLLPTPPDADGNHRSIAFPGLWLDPKALLSGNLDRLAPVVEQGAASPEHAAFVERLKPVRPT